MRKALCLALLAVPWLQSQPAAPQAAFTPGPKNDPATCEDLWKDVGLPRYARATDRSTLMVCHTRYVLSHNNDTKTPDWVLEQLDKSQFSGGIVRPDIKFSPEKNVPKEKAARDEDYTNSKLDRGHQAPSADFASKVEWMNESFILSNAVPQQGIGFNRHIWKDFEDLTRAIASARGRVYVITGPVYRDENGKAPVITKQFNRCGNEIKLQSPDSRQSICEAKNKNPNATCDAGVAVPVGMFKIIYEPSRPLVNAYIMPNINHTEAGETPTPLDYLKKFQVTVHVVERFTSLEFFRNLPTRKRNQLNLICGQAVSR
jgi:DNA/RNA endonuclease G (NUC1)